MKMGTSLDKNDHPKSYYEKLYLSKLNAKNKRTRSNNPFSREQLLQSKRERKDVKVKKEDKDHEIEEENNSIHDDEDSNENENISDESEESDKDTEGKQKSGLGLRKIMTKEIIELNKNYKDSGIKYTRLIPIKKKKNEERKKLFVNEEDNINKTVSSNKNTLLELKEQELSEEQYPNEFSKESPLKQSKNKEQIDVIQNNEFLSDNKDIPQTPINKNENNNDISLKVDEKIPSKEEANTEPKQISFGVPKTQDKNSNSIHFLSQGPISFGFNPNTGSKLFENTESNKSKDDNTNKKYNNFVKNVSEAVKNNINQSQNSTKEKAKVILLKWESPKQKEFLSHSMDIDDNYNNADNAENNNINVSYNFNERLKDLDQDAIKLEKGKRNKPGENLSYNNYMNQSGDNNFTKGKNIQGDGANEYKSKLRSYNKGNIQYNNEDNQENVNNINEYNEKNPIYNIDEPESDEAKHYIDSHDIYGESIPQENKLRENHDNLERNKFYYYYDKDENIIEYENLPCEEKGKNQMQFYTSNDKPNANLSIENKENRDHYNQSVNNKNENINLNAEEEKNVYDELEVNNYLVQQAKEKRKERFLNKISGMKNNIMNKFRNKVCLWPLLLLILFGIVYFLNYSYERFDNCHIIIVFSILMGLLVLYNILRYFLAIKNYKKMAREDRTALLQRLNDENITAETLANNMALVNNFINTRITEHNLSPEEYMKYVFPYLKKYLKKDGYVLNTDDNINDEEQKFWKEI